jgi:predicted RNase H-like nuclease (RuvC/YqgF family)
LWREKYRQAGYERLIDREPDVKDREIEALRAKIGELTMEVELLREKADRLDQQLPLARRRWKR